MTINNESAERSTYKIRRSGLPAELAASLQERILRGEFKEGDQLIQEVLAREYDVSRMPVREALRQLEATGLVKMQLHKGAVVTTIPPEQIAELFHLRAMLETELLAASIANMTAEDLEAAQASLEALEAAYDDNDIGQWAPLNWEFHRALYLPSRMVQTLNIVQMINIQTDRQIRLQLMLTGSFAAAKAEHRKLLRMCKRKEKDKAVAFLREHIEDAGRLLLEVLEKHRSGSLAAS